MSETKDKRRNKRANKFRKPRYKHYPFATSITIYSADGSPVPKSVLDQVETYVASVALQNNLLTSVNRASS